MTQPSPELTVPVAMLSDDETLFRDSVRQFANRAGHLRVYEGGRRD